MYLRGSSWNLKRRVRRRSSPFRILLLVALIGGALYVNQVVVPATPPLFIPTATSTRDPESFLNEANSLFEEGKLSLAIDSYQQAVLVDPDNPAIYLALARAQIYTGKYDEALKSAQNALVLNNSNPLAYAMQAWALDFLQDYTQAEALITRALELDPNSALAHAIYAEILIDKQAAGQGDIGIVEKAIEESRLARSLDPNLLEARRARGYVLWNTGNWEEAIQEYEAALAINDKIADLHLALGFNYHNLGDHARAVQAYLQAFALNPADPTAPYQISRTYATVGDYTKSVQYADQSVKSAPDDPLMHGNLGVMYYKNNQIDQAIEQLSLAIKGGTLEDGTVVQGLPLDYGTVADFYAIYGLILAREDRCAEAVPIFQAIIEGIPEDLTNTGNAELGIILCKEGQEAFEEALNELVGEEQPVEPAVTEAPAEEP